MRAPSIFVAAGVVIVLLVSSRALAFFDKRPQMRYKQSYSFEDRRSHRQLYSNRLSAGFSFNNAEGAQLFELEPFLGFRRDFRNNNWERKEAGLAISKKIFPWLSVSEAVAQVKAKEDWRHYRFYEKREFTESVSRLKFSHGLISNKFINLTGFLINDYIYDLRAGRGIRNEVIGGFAIPVGKHLETELCWRHVDRVHYYDSDNLELSATLLF